MDIAKATIQSCFEEIVEFFQNPVAFNDSLTIITKFDELKSVKDHD